MDRSYLSDQAVVRASRDFICARLATYEDSDELEYMKSIYTFRTATKNSLFAILDPSGEKHLVTPGRSMRNTFSDAEEMAERMGEIAKTYPTSKSPHPKALGLPYLKDVRVALNVAACDSQRLVILHARSSSERRKLESMLVSLAWDEELAGRFLYATTAAKDDLARIDVSTESPGLVVVEPDAYGLKARQVAFVELGAKPAAAKKILVAAADGNEMKSKDSKRHIGRGLREGVTWERAVED